MESQLFIIKSIYVQDGIMFFALAGLIFLLIKSFLNKKIKVLIASAIWIVIVLWFFNTYFGFSSVRVSPEGIELNYGVLSPKNTILSINSKWKIENYLSGIRKSRRVFYIKIADRDSMGVTGRYAQVLEEIGAAIDKMKSQESDSSNS
ncbi:MAG: hypothetical protein JW786_01990 [Desulfobacterales bacterium]|nr:hypothetical protein [Desulfobacterales bacterium]